METETIKLIGDWGNPPHHATPRKRIAKQSKFLLRECPDCGCEALRYRQRFCDSCKKKRRRKTNREYQRKYYGKHRG